ncbi:branched-chain amino acid ABC transporter permease [Ornithinimicrobium cavernae]|uniref:branched-chain amino acid ABC transporter permease n=1 Tax=Ornithinimicrobium cavernae TaxID=2666047 RepID=UPI00137B7154|nr:branched-chain amino acid ABC transporter permease [Ornithinimicrobium cavernae]
MIEQLSNGLVLGAVLAITSLGLSLLFSVTNSFSFAHGDLVTVGAVVAVVLSGASVGLPVWLAIVLACVLGILLGLLLDRVMFRPMRRKGVGGITLLVTTLGLALIVRYVILALVGPGSRALPLEQQRVQTYLGLRLTPSAALAIVLSVVVLVLVGVFLLCTSLGISMRAVANNPQLAMASGISVDRIVAIAWALSTGFAAFGGTIMALTQLVYWDMGFHLLLLIFASVILGGLGTAFGAMVGGFLIGIVTQLSVTLPFVRDHVDLKIAVGLGVMALVLLVRPQGLMGRAVRAS